MSTLKPSSAYDTTLTQAKAVCTALHGADSFGITYMLRDPESMAITKVQDHYGTFEDHQPKLHDFGASGWEAYLMAACTSAAGHSTALVTHSWAVAVDFDNGLPELLESNELIRPTSIVQTSPARFHAVWVLDQVCTPEQMRLLADVIADRLEGDSAFVKCNQMIRLPGFINRKNNHKIKLHGSAGPTAHSYDRLWDAFDASLVVNQQRKAYPRLNDQLVIPKNHANTAEEMFADAQNALEHLAEWAEHYDKWLKVGMALAALGAPGLELFHSFSKQSAKYDAAAVDAKWTSILKSNGAKSSLKPLFSAAQKAGWKNPGFRKEKPEFQGMPTDRELGARCALQMQDKFAVMKVQLGTKTEIRFLKLENGVYRVLDDIQRREEAEKHCHAVIAEMGKTDDSDWKKELRRRNGTNRGMDTLCEHIAEKLFQLQRGNEVKSYPYLPVANGVLNLLSRELVPSRYRPLPSQITAVSYDPLATAPLFSRVLDEIFEFNEPMKRFVLRLFGLFMLGRPIEKIFVIWYGPSANNGKSKLINVLKGVLGPYFTMLPTAALMLKSHTSDGANPSIAQLGGKRLAVVSEPTDKQVLDVSLVKQLTGDGHINVRGIYGAPVDMEIEATFLMVTNAMPRVREDDEGFWNRALVVPFNRSFSKEEEDRELDAKLAKEYPGILNMMLDGLHDYLVNGLNRPDQIGQATQGQRDGADPFAAFFADILVRSATATTNLKDIHAAYLTWQKQSQRFRQLSKTELSERLESEFKKRTKSNLPVFDGVALQVA